MPKDVLGTWDRKDGDKASAVGTWDGLRMSRDVLGTWDGKDRGIRHQYRWRSQL